jgi:IS1 family transposase
MNVLSREDQVSVLHQLVEGTSLRSTTRLTGIHRTTIMKLMVSIGERVRHFLNLKMTHLHLNHIQIDEIWTFVLKKQARLAPEEQDNPMIGDQFLFIGLDEETKLVPSFMIGKRNGEVTEAFTNDLQRRIVASHRNPVQLSTDGWRAYPGAIDMAFGNSAEHGILIKDFADAEQPGRYGPPEVVGEHRIPRAPHLDPNEICTSHVERHNLSIRTFMRRFTRLALGFSKKLQNLEAATSLYVGHYNFCRWHGTLNKTPAMAAGLTGHPWTLAELLTEAGI